MLCYQKVWIMVRERVVRLWPQSPSHPSRSQAATVDPHNPAQSAREPPTLDFRAAQFGCRRQHRPPGRATRCTPRCRDLPTHPHVFLRSPKMLAPRLQQIRPCPRKRQGLKVANRKITCSLVWSVRYNSRCRSLCQEIVAAAADFWRKPPALQNPHRISRYSRQELIDNKTCMLTHRSKKVTPFPPCHQPMLPH